MNFLIKCNLNCKNVKYGYFGRFNNPKVSFTVIIFLDTSLEWT